MATQLATTEPRPGKAVAKAPVIAGNAIRAFVPQTLEEAWRLSTAIAQSGMAPKSYGTDANKIMVGIMAGAEVGMTPFVALQSFANINGNPSLWGDGMLGLVEASGLLDDIEETDDGREATCRVVRKGRPTPVVNTFSMDDAKVAGLLGKQGPWQTAPKRMRKLRARAFSLRDAFSDVLKGIKSAEEVRDYAPMDGGTLGGERVVLSVDMLADHTDEQVDATTGEVTAGDQAAEKAGDQSDSAETSGTKAAAIMFRIAKADDLATVEAIEAEYREYARADLNVPDQDKVETAIDAAKKRVAK